MGHDPPRLPHAAWLLWTAIKMLSPSRNLDAAGDRPHWAALERWAETQEVHSQHLRAAMQHLLDDQTWNAEARETVCDFYARLFKEVFPHHDPNL